MKLEALWSSSLKYFFNYLIPYSLSTILLLANVCFNRLKHICCKKLIDPSGKWRSWWVLLPMGYVTRKSIQVLVGAYWYSLVLFDTFWYLLVLMIAFAHGTCNMQWHSVTKTSNGTQMWTKHLFFVLISRRVVALVWIRLNKFCVFAFETNKLCDSFVLWDLACW